MTEDEHPDPVWAAQAAVELAALRIRLDELRTRARAFTDQVRARIEEDRR